MSLKDNFNQAIKEILKKDGLDPSKNADKKRPDFSSYLENPEKTVELNAEETESTITPAAAPKVSDADAVLRSVRPVPADRGSVYPKGSAVESLLGNAGKNIANPDDEDYDAFGEPADPENIQDELMSMGRPPRSGFSGANARPRNFAGGYGGGYSGGGYNGSGGYGMSPSEMDMLQQEETTIISRNTVIEGNIKAFANVAIEGSVKGDIKITKDLSMSGRVIGDIECNNSSLSGASMQGNISSKGQVQLDRDSLLLGDISAGYLNINGKIKGNLDIGGKAEFKADAFIMGNISAATITVIDGANIQGYVNTTAFKETTANVFPESIAIEDN
ncbi:MAG: polymer-forming cytoskeletal protein [Ruminococcus sp.]|jgi:cytoskeletal protein CcmA (bactofilin family)|nr:polymer-forming cytoskeletal protein [Ruminococcus sp.]